MTNVAYRRVSTTDQNTDRQLDNQTFDKEFTDKASGASTNRPALAELRGWVRQGDTIHVHSIDRLARDTQDLLSLVKEFNSRGVSIRFHKEGLLFSGDNNSAMNKLMFTMLAGFAEFERSMIRERQREGVAKAKDRGVYRGGKPQVDRQKFATLVAEGKNPTQIAKEMNISRQSVYRLQKELNQTPA